MGQLDCKASSMKILATADLHLNDRHRDRYRHDFQQWLQRTAWEHRVDHVIILGDLTEEKDNHPAWLVNKIVDHMKRLSRCAPVTILRGNHDYLDIGSPFFEFLGKFEGIKWIGTPNAQHLPGKLFLPHTRDPKTWDKLDLKKFGWIYTHNTFEGATSESGRTMRGIPTSVFPPGPVVISGDVHLPQRIGPVTYVGAPYTVDFGDRFQPRVLLIDGTKVTSIPCPGVQKRLLEMNWLPEGTDMQVLTEAFGKKVKKGDLVKIRVNLTPDQQQYWKEIDDILHKWADQRQFDLISTSSDMQVESTKEIVKALQRRTDNDLIKEYVQRQRAGTKTEKTGALLKDQAG